MNLNSESLGKIATALVAAQATMGNAVKDSKNPFFKSNYADLNSIREAVLPAFNANGISVIQPTIVLEGKKYVQTILIHSSGEFISGLTEILSVKELDAQAQGSGISYARRYGLQSIANVGAEDDDGQGAVGKPYAGPANKGYQSAPVPSAAPVKATITVTSTAPNGGSSTASVSAPAQEAPKSRSFRTNKPTTTEEL